MTKKQLFLLHSQIPRLKAERELYERSIKTELGWKRAYALIKTATGDEELARKLSSKILMKEVRDTCLKSSPSG